MIFPKAWIPVAMAASLGSASQSILAKPPIENTITPLARGITHDAFYDLCFSGTAGVAVGADGVIKETSNGGNQWHRLTPQPVDLALLGVTCSADTVLAVGQQGTVLHRQDDQWRNIDAGSDQRLLAVSLNSSGLAIAVGGFGTVLRSLDGGNHWETLTFDWESLMGDLIEPHLYDVQVEESGRITMVGEFGLVMQSDNGGKDWRKIRQGEASLFALALLPSGQGISVGQDGIILTTRDGGKSWQRVSSGTRSNLLGVSLSSHGAAWVTGIRTLLISEDLGASWQPITQGDATTGWYQGIASIPMADGQEYVIAAGHTGKLIKMSRNQNQY